MRQFILGSQVSMSFTSLGLVSNKVTNGTITFAGVFKDGVIVPNLTPSFSEIGSGFYRFNFTPSSTGVYEVLVEGQIYVLEVVTATFSSILSDILDSVAGSWEWNKLTGQVTFYRLNGTSLYSYNMINGSDSASREKIS